MTFEILVNIGSGNGFLLPDGTKPLPEPMLTIISKALWHSSRDIIIRKFEATNQYSKIENYIFKITLRSPRGQWVNLISANQKVLDGMIQSTLNISRSTIILHRIQIINNNGEYSSDFICTQNAHHTSPEHANYSVPIISNVKIMTAIFR